MSNHSSDPTDPPDPAMRELFDKMKQALGPTGEHPRGMLTPTDEGGIRFAVGSKNGVVVIDFGKPVAWVGMPPAEARQLAESLVKHADHIEQKRLEREAAESKGGPTR
jgi:hypothetical protein